MELLKIVIWPIIVLLGLLIFRKPISDLIRAVKGIEHRKGENGSQTKVSFIEEALEQPKKALEIEKSSDIQTVEMFPDPKQAMLDAYSQLEMLASNKIKDLGINLPSKNFNNTPLCYLEYKGSFSPKIESALQHVRLLRNQVSHYSAKDIKKKDAEDYLRVIEKLKKHIDAVDALPIMNLNAITMIIRTLSIIIDKNEYQHISIGEVHKKIEDGSLLHYIADFDGAAELKGALDSGLYKGFDRVYLQSIQSIYYACAGDERRKWGIEHSGICLLLAWTNEIVQMGSGWHPETNLSHIEKS